MNTFSSFLEKAQNLKSLPSPPHVAVKVLDVCQDPDKGVGELSEILSLDSALSAKVLKMSNSPTLSRGREITSVAMAISTLGTSNVSIIALGFSLQNSIPNWRHHSGLSDADMWRFNVATAVTSRGLSRLVGGTDHDTAFMCGLMSRIGQLLMYTIAPKDYGDVIDQMDGQLPSPELEEAMLGVNHHVVGRMLLEKWNLPKTICDVVEHWDNLDAVEGETRKTAAIVHVANLTAELLFEKDKANGLQQLHNTAKDLLQLTKGEINRQFVACQEELRDTLAAFDDSTANEIDCEAIMDEARSALVEASLNLVSDLSNAQSQSSLLQRENQALAIASKTDSLTGLLNRAALNAEISELAETRKDEPRPFSIIMVDIDHFKEFNDQHGHLVGDQVLKSVGQSLKRSARATDIVARYGGEEFTVILTNTGKKNSVNAAERYRRAIEREKIEVDNKSLAITASLGVASSDYFENTKTVMELLSLADAALYEAKRRGKNCTVSCIELKELKSASV